jgi:predicted regulator of Ras-like GTPase activity (Roadblock/LC7/MglB family)
MTQATGEIHDPRKLILSELIERSGAGTALLVTKEGFAETHAGDTSYLNTTAMAALVAGMFSATREVARMVGEKQFSILLQQGENRHIHISLIHNATMMVIIFDDYQRIGKVRHEARRAAEQLNRAAQPAAGTETAAAAVPAPEFKEYALNLIDRIFQTDS